MEKREYEVYLDTLANMAQAPSESVVDYILTQWEHDLPDRKTLKASVSIMIKDMSSLKLDQILRLIIYLAATGAVEH